VNFYRKLHLIPNRKSHFQIVVSDNKTRFTTQFNPHIQLKKNKGYEIALANLETYYSFPNITEENYRFMYSPDEGLTWFVIFIPEGSYDMEDINKVIEQKITKNGHCNKITISANTNTLKAVLILENGYQVDFCPPDSISSDVGFNNDLYATNYQESENPVNILSVNSILVNNDIISGSYLNGQRYPTIYSFFPGVFPGYKIIETPSNLVYLPVTLDAIYSMQTSLTDQNGKLLNLRGENVPITFRVQEIQIKIYSAYKKMYTNVSVNISDKQKEELKKALATGANVSSSFSRRSGRKRCHRRYAVAAE